MSRGSKFGAWFAEQFPHHAEAMKLNLAEAIISAAKARDAADDAQKRLNAIKSAHAAYDVALRSWVARRMK